MRYQAMRSLSHSFSVLNRRMTSRGGIDCRPGKFGSNDLTLMPWMRIDIVVVEHRLNRFELGLMKVCDWLYGRSTWVQQAALEGGAHMRCPVSGPMLRIRVGPDMPGETDQSASREGDPSV